MIHSMTGFGSGEYLINGKKITINLRSVNSKQLDLTCKIPSFLKSLESEIRRIIAPIIVRGKAEISIFIEREQTQKQAIINQIVAQKYIDDLRTLCKTSNLRQDEILSSVLRLPNVIEYEENDNILDEEQQQIILNYIDEVCGQFTEFRKIEGDKLEQTLKDELAFIQQAISKIEPYETQRIDTIKNRIKEALENIIPSEKIDKNRFEQELIFYIERLDIAEEKQRLNAHCEHFLEVLEAGDLAKGKKLGFISQEIGREINTLGSKSNHADMQKIVVSMKDALEKIKEQIFNIL